MTGALLIAALLLLGVAVALGVLSALLAGRRLLAAAHAALAAATLVLLIAVVLRAVEAGRAPWSNLHETAIAFALALLSAFLLLERRLAVRPLVPVVAAIAIGLLWLAASQPDEVRPLVPALQAPLLLTVHVGSAMLAYALGALAFAAAAAEIAQGRAGGSLRFLPTVANAREAAHRAVVVGFPVLTAAIVLGSVWANLAWRSYWSNDPKELAAAATWLVYAGYLHAAGRRDRIGRLAPWLLVLGFAGVLFTYLGAGLVFVGEHSYAGA
ncbi:MAG TPA: cytochrome c biogenesis protein CcsA [Candidatus Limnocylindria bacterium]